jgi:dihydrodipicolinate synthase/N-acetylneuraminate lyase
MIPEFLTGVIAPMFTPCNADGTLDTRGAGEFARFLLERDGITTVFPRSGLGKMYTFKKNEVKQIIDAAMDAVGGKIGVVPGTAGVWDRNFDEKPDPERYTEETIELSQYAQDKEADGVVIVIPEALPEEPKATLHDRMCEYYQRVADTVDLPIVIYHPGAIIEPYRMTPELFKNLVQIDGIAGMKYSIVDMDKFAAVARFAPDEFALIAGAESVFLPALALGGVGVIGQGCCICPEILRAVHDYYNRGEIEQARKAQFAVNDLLVASSGMDIAVFGKMYAMKKGYSLEPFPRSTERAITEEQYERYAAILEKELATYRA